LGTSQAQGAWPRARRFEETFGTCLILQAWDWHFWTERVRKEKFDLNEAEIKPYLQLNKLMEAMFYGGAQTVVSCSTSKPVTQYCQIPRN
jgi:Zn-dependent oligopeptidase